jgi:hypothetical protein
VLDVSPESTDSLPDDACVASLVELVSPASVVVGPAPELELAAPVEPSLEVPVSEVSELPPSSPHPAAKSSAKRSGRSFAIAGNVMAMRVDEQPNRGVPR